MRFQVIRARTGLSRNVIRMAFVKRLPNVHLLGIQRHSSTYCERSVHTRTEHRTMAAISISFVIWFFDDQITFVDTMTIASPKYRLRLKTNKRIMWNCNLKLNLINANSINRTQTSRCENPNYKFMHTPIPRQLINCAIVAAFQRYANASTICDLRWASALSEECEMKYLPQPLARRVGVYVH